MAKTKSTSKAKVIPTADAATNDRELTLRCAVHCSEIRGALDKGYALVTGAVAAIKDGQLYTAKDLLDMAEEILGDRFTLGMLEGELGIDTRRKDEVDLPSVQAQRAEVAHV